MYGLGAYSEITYCGLAGAAAPPPADDPETRFVLDDVRIDDDLDAFHDFLAQLVEDAVALDDSETRFTVDESWWLHDDAEAGEELAQAYVEDSVEFILDTLAVHEVEADDDFQAWLDVVIEDAAAVADQLETRLAAYDDWEPENWDDFGYGVLDQAIDEPPPAPAGGDEWIIRARRRGRR